jgi:penicillin-binding protein 2
VIDGMVGVMSPGGTAYRTQAGAPYQMAGKTGTAQVFTVGQNEKYRESEVAERLRDHALFIAFAPADAPKLAIAVLVENGRSGSGTAAPIARKVFDAYLVPPEAAAATPPAEAAADTPPAGGAEE